MLPNTIAENREPLDALLGLKDKVAQEKKKSALSQKLFTMYSNYV